MKVVFTYKRVEYFVICRSFNTSKGCSWFYTSEKVMHVRDKVDVKSVYRLNDETYKELDGYTNYPFDM
jgi:hypothetical protein